MLVSLSTRTIACFTVLTFLPRFACTQGSVNNALCFKGPYRTFDPLVTKAHVMLSPGMGHWGSDARPGVRLRSHSCSNVVAAVP